MEELLKDLADDKKIAIINSGMKEFSKNSFQKASTNVIVKDAGISKGLLFHYFGKKARLYDYLKYFSIKIMTEEIQEKLDWNQADIFLRLKEILMIKFNIFREYPYLADFSLRVHQDKGMEEIRKSYPDKTLEIYHQIYYLNIDYSLFKETVDLEKAMNIIRWTFEKYGDDLREKMKNEDLPFNDRKIEEEILDYISILKNCFCKKGRS